jgi:hypothetical protein
MRDSKIIIIIKKKVMSDWCDRGSDRGREKIKVKSKKSSVEGSLYYHRQNINPRANISCPS